MTREEKQKAINVLKKSAPIIAVTQEEFSDYIQTINQVIDWLEQDVNDEDAVEIKGIVTVTVTVNDYIQTCMNYYNKGRQDEIDKMDWRI